MHVKKIHVFLFPFITVLGDFCGKFTPEDQTKPRLWD